MANETRTNIELREAITGLINSALPLDKNMLKDALGALLTYQQPILAARIAAQTKLYSERDRFRYPKDKDYTDWDRKIMLDSATATAQADYELFVGIEKALEQRIGIIQTLLAC